MRFIPLLLSLLLSGAISAAKPDPVMTPSFPALGEWPAYRRNGSLDARSPLKGAIVQPLIAWKRYVGMTEKWFIASGENSERSDLAPKSKSFDAAILSDPRWGLLSPTGEIEGRPRPVQQNSTTAYAHVLPSEPGLQKIEFESAFAKPTTNGDWAHDCVGRCYAWRGGKWALVWETKPIDYLFQPQPIVGDFDGDGQPEIAILPWKELLILDARTGAVKDRCAFTDGRSYGFYGAYDLDGDGVSEFVIQADFAKHVEVLGYRNKKLSLLWRQEIETDISNPQKVLRVPPEPVADVDGDGVKEVLVSLFNGTGDGRWHLIVHDGLTGAVKADLPDEYLQSAVDVDGDGIRELLTTHATGAGTPTYGELRVWSLKGGKPKILWEGKGMAWQMWSRPQPPNVNSGATLAGQDVLARQVHGRMRVVLRKLTSDRGSESRVELQVREWGSRGFSTDAEKDASDGASGGKSYRIAGSDLAAVAMDDEGRILVRGLSRAESGRTGKTVGAIRYLGESSWGVPPVPCAVAWERNATRPTIFVSGSTGEEEIVAFHPPVDGKPSEEPLRIRGRGLGFSWPASQMYGPVVADLFGDGRRQLLRASSSPKGYARIVASNLSGEEMWHHDFPDIPGGSPIWNVGGIVYWQAGHLTDRRRQDVLVTVRRSMMHSEETALLSGESGKLIWRRVRQESGSHSRGICGPFALADFDGDGLDDLACLHPSDYFILQGKTGKNLLSQDTKWPEVPGSDVYWGIPIAGDFEGTGKTDLYFGTERRSMTGLLRSDGSLVWHDALDRATTSLPAFGDFTGSGKKEVIGIGFDDGIRCYDAATGTVLWRLANPAGADATGTASADINGDGRDEALFSSGSALYCVGTVERDGKKAGALLWKIEMPTTVSSPVIADVEGEGRASVLLTGSDGWVYCIQ